MICCSSGSLTKTGAARNPTHPVDFYHAPSKEKLRYAIRTLRCATIHRSLAVSVVLARQRRSV